MLVCFPLVVRILYLSLYCCALLCVLSSLAIILKKKRERERAGYFALLSYICLVTVNVLRLLLMGALGWSVACDCDIS